MSNADSMQVLTAMILKGEMDDLFKNLKSNDVQFKRDTEQVNWDWSSGDAKHMEIYLRSMMQIKEKNKSILKNYSKKKKKLMELPKDVLCQVQGCSQDALDDTFETMKGYVDYEEDTCGENINKNLFHLSDIISDSL